MLARTDNAEECDVDASVLTPDSDETSFKYGNLLLSLYQVDRAIARKRRHVLQPGTGAHDRSREREYVSIAAALAQDRVETTELRTGPRKRSVRLAQHSRGPLDPLPETEV